MIPASPHLIDTQAQSMTGILETVHIENKDVFRGNSSIICKPKSNDSKSKLWCPRTPERANLIFPLQAGINNSF